MSADDIEVHALPMYHCAQLDCFFCVDVYLGATSIILPSPDPAALLAAIAREQVVPRDGVTVTVEDVKAHVKTRLAGFKRPKYIILADTLPKNPSGKILKRELRQQHANLAAAHPQAAAPKPPPTALVPGATW
jgi:acyl-CoA synthetase (AMP-forming)/AMP-acid ligase II